MKKLPSSDHSTNIPKPFLKWAGGKTQLLSQLGPLFPKKFNGYHEPFLGSAAVYFHLYGLKQRGSLKSQLRRVRLTDSNDELINCFRAVEDNVDQLVSLLAKHKARHSKAYYYKIRSQVPEKLTDLERAARMIYLNKTCFNGLYRVNSKGQFNVPIGQYKNPGIYNADELYKAKDALQKVDVEVADFRDVVKRAKAGDFVYFDPPYHPRDATSSFTSYTEDSFGFQEQRDLAQVFRDLDKKGCRVMLSNSWTSETLDLYAGYTIIEVRASRLINSNAETRGKIKEMVVLNYDPLVEGDDLIMSGGETAVSTGSELKNKVIEIGKHLGLEVRSEVRVGKRLWGATRLIDVVIIERVSRKSIGIECKFQGGSGSAEEKVPTTIKDIDAWPIPGIVVLGGDGFSTNMKSFLYSTGKAVDVEDLEDWLKLYFGLPLSLPDISAGK